jgi:tetratricopeptide (TPR) repeat protein
MAPHFSAAAETAAGDPVAEQAAAIMRQASDPIERAALATRLVQDKISYLLNGLDGGNYLPQQAAFTWDKRYGDCKAKSVLLLALLQRMGIEAEPVLVTTRGGDALPELLPLPGNFDHVIVRATIAGVDYWLDGTSAGTRLSNIGNVPPFHYALPLRAGGAELIPMTQRERAVPDMRMAFAVDHSAGVDLPQLFSVTMEVSGPGGAMAEAMADADDPEQLRRMASSFAGSSGFENSVLTSIEVSYDKERAVGRMAFEGIGPPSFTWQDGKLVVDTSGPGNEGFSFNPNRSRREWRDIPVATPGPSYVQTEMSMILPARGRGFSLTGPERFEGGFANTRLVTVTSLSGERLTSQADIRVGLGEIVPGAISEARRQALRIEADAPELVAPADVRWRWDLDPAERRAKAAPILAAFDKAAELAMEDDFSPLIQRAMFLQNIYEHEAALAAYGELVEKSPSAWAHLQRATVLLELGRRTDALADLQASYDLEPHNSTAISLARELAYAGKTDEALALLEGLPIGEDEEIDYADARAHISGLLGDTGSALSLLAEEVAGKPDNAEVLNSDCWFRGLFNVALDTAVGSCTRAVERADEPMAALDSRAMVQFRLGNYDAAITDLDAALRLEPGIAGSRYLRGVVRLRKGDRAGREDIETALRMSPNLAEFYGRHGVSPAS